MPPSRQPRRTNGSERSCSPAPAGSSRAASTSRPNAGWDLASDGSYTIGVNEVAIGAAWPVAALEIMRSRLPHRLLSELRLRARLVPSEEAIRLGLADEVVPADQLEDRAVALARELGAA